MNMYLPQFRISDEVLSLVAEICTLLPSRKTEPASIDWSADAICRQHAAMGGQEQFRTTGHRPHWIPVLMNALLHWLQTTETHILIRSAVFHYEFMAIRPFEAGNGPLATRLQQQLLGIFHPRWAEVQTLVPPQEYEEALAAADASEFVLLSLRAILAALQQEEPTVRPHNRIPRKTSPSDQLLAYLRRHPGSKRNDLLNALPELSARMLDRHLQSLKDDGSIEYRGSRKTGAYFAH